MDQRRKIGRQGEEEATQYLLHQGYQIIDRNWSIRWGELDIIAFYDRQLIIVEVRTTTNQSFGFGFQSVNRKKQDKIRKLALYYIQTMKGKNVPIRFDVISVLLDKQGNKLQLDHIPAAF